MSSKRESASFIKGPESPTFLEWLINAFHIPFSWGCLLLTFVFSPPGPLLLTYVQTSSIEDAFSRTICLFLGEDIPGWSGVAALTLFSIILFYFLYMIRYMRLKLVAAKPMLLPLLPEGEETFNKIFSTVSQLLPPLLLGAILMILVNLQTYPDLPSNYVKFIESSSANLYFVFVWLLFWLIIVGTFIWVYFGSIRGLHRLGKESLNLTSFRDDKMLGARPIGLLSLSFASIYIVGMGLAVFMVLIMLPLSSTLLYTSLVAFLILLGIAFFFLPLYTVHQRMMEAKNLEQEALRQQFSKVYEMSKASEVSQKEVSEALDRLTNIITIDVTKAEVDAIPTWPVDLPILSRLVTLMLSIIGIIVANYVMRYFLRWI
jgi:hypothetical protein